MNIANLYDNGPISPICQIKEHLAVYTDQQWRGFLVEYIEGVPRSSAYVVDLITIAGANPVAPLGTVAAQLLPILQVHANELVHNRWYAIDDIEGQLWQLSNMARLAPRGGQAGVNLFTPIYDPWLAGTTFWVMGGLGDKDARVGCTNISGATIPQARLGFFGYRYILQEEPAIHPNARYVPAQGR